MVVATEIATVYRLKPSAHIRLKREQVTPAVEAVEKLRVAHGGSVSPVDVLAAAKDKTSPLNPIFEWNNKAAAHEYRLVQSRYFLRSVIVLRHESRESSDTPAAQPCPIRMYHRATIPNEDGPPARRYVSLRQVIETPEIRAEVLADAKRDLRAFGDKYQTLRDVPGAEGLKPVFTAIDELD